MVIETDKHAVIRDPNRVQERCIVQRIEPGDILFRKKFPDLLRLGLLISRQQFRPSAWHGKKWAVNHIYILTFWCTPPGADVDWGEKPENFIPGHKKPIARFTAGS
jgi:hypothetical protein